MCLNVKVAEAEGAGSVRGLLPALTPPPGRRPAAPRVSGQSQLEPVLVLLPGGRIWVPDW